MADKQTMEITILPSGEVKIAVKCVPGAACAEFSAALENSLGTVKSRERTAEFYEEAKVDETVAVGTGRNG
jgi:3-mercaptopyruvate sulfurtransferase SseA